MKLALQSSCLALVLTGLCAPAHAAPPPSPRAVAEQFYRAFTQLQPALLAPLYAPNVRFKDAVFQYDDRAGTLGMWMQILGAKPAPRIRYSLQEVVGNTVRGRWVADYVFLGRPVHNEITSTLIIRGGRIVEHTDAFPFAPWAAQAFGLKGTRLEWLARDRYFEAIVVRALRLAIGAGAKVANLCEVVRHSARLARVFGAACGKR